MSSRADADELMAKTNIDEVKELLGFHLFEITRANDRLELPYAYVRCASARTNAGW